MKAGPKTRASLKPLVERDLAGLTGAARVVGWIEKFVIVSRASALAWLSERDREEATK